jgi:hydrophobe/amphiphile efflux-1 (HAE1) family protein
MDLAALSLRRPVLTLVASLLIVVAGVVGLSRLAIREYPAVDPPTLSISTGYPGASAEVIEAQITEPIEEAVNSVAGIRTITSTSREGSSQISVEFTLDTDLDTAASDVRDQLSRATRNLPPDCNPPILIKSNADSNPILGLALSSDRRGPLELSALADLLKERLQTVPGVAAVDQPAEKRYAMRLWLDPDRLLAHGLTPLDVRAALARENVELPAGRIEGESVELPVKTLSRLALPAEFDAVVVKRDGERVVRVRDIGYTELGPQNERSFLKLGRTPVAGLYFRPQPGANQIEIVDEIMRRLGPLQRELPADVRLELAYDNTQYVRQSLVEVGETVLIAFALVVLVVFAFLREWRSTLIPVLAIPVSVVGTFALLAVSGFSINTLTLLGLVLAIGLVVDDAIVVLENIHAKIEAGAPPARAAVEGTREIFGAVIATTLVLAVVFLPLLFLGGLTGRLFREFGVTIAGAVLLSAFVALTLTPLLSGRLLGAHTGGGWLHRRTEPFFRGLESGYAVLLGGSLRRSWLAPVAIVLALAATWAAQRVLPRELTPLEDRGRIWVRATATEGAGFDYMQAFMDDLTHLVDEQVPEAQLMMTQVPGFGGAPGAQGPVNGGFVRVFLKDRGERGRSQQEIAQALQGAVRGITGARVNITQEASIGERRAAVSGVQFVIQAGGLDALAEGLPRFLEELRKSPVFTFVDSDLKFNKPELRVRLDREKAQALGVSAQEIAQTLQSSLSGQRFGYFLLNGRQYEVLGQLTRDFRSQPGDLSRLGVRAAGGEIVRMDNLVSLEERSAPPELFRYNRESAATVSGTLAPGRSLSEGVAVMRAAAQSVLDERFRTALTGSARDFEDSSSSLGWVFGLAVLLVYLVLAAQFESFVDPLIILLTVPLALAGAFGALWATGQTLNLFSQIGLIMLVGLVTKNGILIVEFAQQRRAAGRSPREAVQEAAIARLRPILMTTLATILGILPITLALGAGAESRVSMGIGVIGGLLVGGALTLFVIPAMCVLVYAQAKPAPLPAGELLPASPH